MHTGLWLRLRRAASTSTTITFTRANCHSAATNVRASDGKMAQERLTFTHSSSLSMLKWVTSGAHFSYLDIDIITE